MRGSLAVLIALVACGDSTPSLPDAGAPDAPVDMPPDSRACAEFAAPGLAVPAHVEGTLAGADLISPQECGVIDAPYGVESAGIDRVVPLTNLRPGAAYVVKLTSPSDLAFYITTGCATATGPGADQCLLFEDASSGDVEVGRFVAGGSNAYVVIDYFASQAPSSSAFTLDVYEEQCQESAQCGSATPACSDGLCVECVTSFDCQSAAEPRCDVMSHQCAAGVDSCTTNDPAEPADDGPAGARELALDGLGRASLTSSVCSDPHAEVDYYAFDVTTLGETWDFTLAWIGGRDLDLELYDARGVPLGLSYWEQPEVARLTYLPLGRYYVRVDEYASSQDKTPIAYTLSAQRTLGTACSSAADCASEYRNQIYRGRCDAGACVSIDGDGAVGEGGACDSRSDCGLALQCPSFFFVADADTRNTCARACDVDTHCGPLGPNYVCTSYLENNFCVQKCTADEQCPAVIDAEPGAGYPWRRLSCDVSSGRCYVP